VAADSGRPCEPGVFRSATIVECDPEPDAARAKMNGYDMVVARAPSVA
jgi:hypothetical protein